MTEVDEVLRSAPPATLDVDVCRAIDVAPEFRDAGDGEDGSPGTMVGHFSVFDKWYEINSFFEGHFLERIAPGAFKRTINNRSGETPVRVLLEHGFDPQVGDKPLGVHSVLEERGTGGYSEVPLFDTSYNRDLAPALRGGAYGKSFRFQVLRDEWVEEPEVSEHNPKGIPERTIKEVRLIEEGPTVFPASPATDAGLRSTTDHYYERLRKRDAAAYDAAVERVRSARTPIPAPAGEPDPAPVSPEDPPTRHSEDPPPADTGSGHSEDSPGQHSAASDVPTNQNRSTNMADETMTVEERMARQSEIRARLAEIDSEYNAAELPEDIQTEWNSLDEEYDEHDRAIEADRVRKDKLRKMAEQPGGVERVSEVRNAPHVTRRPENIYDLSAIRSQARSIDELPQLYRDNAMRAVEQARFPGAQDRSKAQEQVERLLDTVDDENGTLARRILVTGSPTYDRAFGKAMTALSTSGLTGEEQRALSLGTDAAGGFAVPFSLDPTVILTSDGQVDPLRRIARVEQITGKTWQGVTSAGITVSRAAEAAEAGDDSPTLAQPEVTPTRVHGFVPFSIEIDQDWAAMRSEITSMLGEAKSEEEATSFTLGDGTGNNPSGVVTTLASSSHVDAAGEGVAVGDLYALEEALPPRFRGRAQWLANRSIYNTVRQLDTAGGANLWVRLANGLPPELIGYPANEASAMDGSIDPGATGTNLVLLFGDFSKFLIVDRVGMSVELVPHLFGTTRRPTGQRGIYAIWRNSSKVLVDNAFRLLKVSTTL